jgi:hypothetical protein
METTKQDSVTPSASQVFDRLLANRNDEEAQLTATIVRGLAGYPEHDDNGAEALRQAEWALRRLMELVQDKPLVRSASADPGAQGAQGAEALAG